MTGLVLRFVALMATVLLMTMTFTHLWQLPPRMAYEGRFWLQTLTMYRELGPDGPGPLVEVGAMISVLALALLEPRGPVRSAARIALLLLLASFAAWWIGVRPVNLEMLGWKTLGLPSDWARYRLRWEYTHAARALTVATAFALLLASLLVEHRRARGLIQLGS